MMAKRPARYTRVARVRGAAVPIRMLYVEMEAEGSGMRFTFWGKSDREHEIDKVV